MELYKVETLNEIEALANVLTSPKDIAIILEIDHAEFIRELKAPESEVYKAFYKGFLLRANKNAKETQGTFDVDSAEFTAKEIKEFRLKLLIQLEL